ncbi:MAG: hypothetical protein L6Q37_06195 [Bdellovibrionaceae bacterium]|nr:hypothetical protein [Pseudobdellovibrionaceae bacterium]
MLFILCCFNLKVFGEKKISSLNESVVKNSVSQNETISDSRFFISMRALSNENLYSKADVFGFKIYYFLTYNINPFISFELTPLAQLQSGHIQSVDASEKLENKLTLLKGAMFFKWMKESYFSLGILNAEENYSSILASEKGFFSTQILQSLTFNPWTFSGYVLGAIPNSESSVSDQNAKESTPLLTTAGLRSRWKVNDYNKTQLRVSYFKYSQIPTSVSTQSVQSGNTPYDFKISDTERNFKYDYAGIDTSIEFKKSVTKKLYALGEGSFVKNDKAPESLNQGVQLIGGLGYRLNLEYEIEVLSGYYKIEPDAVIAYYGNSRFFRTNHQGIETKGALLFKKQQFKISFYYNDSKLIYENPAQSDEKLYLLKFEVSHDTF